MIPQPSVTQVAIRAAYQRLGNLLGEEQPAVAVRSSAMDEDSATAAFAGQYETYRNVIGADEGIFKFSYLSVDGDAGIVQIVE